MLKNKKLRIHLQYFIKSECIFIVFFKIRKQTSKSDLSFNKKSTCSSESVTDLLEDHARKTSFSKTRFSHHVVVRSWPKQSFQPRATGSSNFQCLSSHSSEFQWSRGQDNDLWTNRPVKGCPESVEYRQTQVQSHPFLPSSKCSSLLRNLFFCSPLPRPPISFFTHHFSLGFRSRSIVQSLSCSTSEEKYVNFSMFRKFRKVLRLVKTKIVLSRQRNYYKLGCVTDKMIRFDLNWQTRNNTEKINEKDSIVNLSGFLFSLVFSPTAKWVKWNQVNSFAPLTYRSLHDSKYGTGTRR